MAWTDFYIGTASGGSNTNSGTTTGSFIFSTTGGWDSTTNVFTAASPGFFTGNASAGDWVAISGGTGVLIATIDSVDGSGDFVTLSATVRVGISPTTAASGRTCTKGGAWADFGVFSSSGIMTSGLAPVPMRINVRGDLGTYANTVSRTNNVAGTAVNPIWIRGYYSTPGDCSADPTLTRPQLTWSAGSGFTSSQAFLRVSCIDFTGNINTQIVNVAGSQGLWECCAIENTNTGASSTSVFVNTTTAAFIRCSFKAPSTVTRGLYASNATYLYGCLIQGGDIGVAGGSATLFMYRCIIEGCGTDGIQKLGGPLFVVGCAVYNVGANGISLDTTALTTGLIINNILSTCGGYGIANTTATAHANVTRSHNLFHSCTSGAESGFGDLPDRYRQTDSSSPFVNAAGHDFRLVATSNARGNGFPGWFTDPFGRNRSFEDIGPVQRAETYVPYLTQRAKRELMAGIAGLG